MRGRTFGRSAIHSAAGLFIATAALAQSAPPPQQPADSPQGEKPRATDASREALTVAYTHNAFGSSPMTIGGAGFGDFHGGSGNDDFLGGGLRVWGSPLKRLTLMADGARRQNGEFAPSIGAQVRVLGDRADGWGLGLLGRYKAEGFAELEGETEFAVLGSYALHKVHVDVNGVIGGNVEEEEGDAEFLARAGYEFTPFLRAGFEGRARFRIAGEKERPGARTWDAVFGAQVMGYTGPVFAALTAGPSTVGVSEKVGWAIIVTAGAIAF